MLPKAEMSTRSFWSGTISFGLVSVPVDLFAANRVVTAGLRMLGPEGQPLRRRYICSEEGKPVGQDDLVRGFETSEGEFVTVTDEELEALEPDKTRDIDLNRFVPRSAVSPVYFERGYYLVPSGTSSKAYRLLAATMEKADKVGIGTFVMRGKAHVVAIFAEQGILHAQTLRFFDELRAPKDLGIEQPKTRPTKLVAELNKFIARNSKSTFDLESLDDPQTEAMSDVAKAKLKAHKDVVIVDEPSAGDETLEAAGDEEGGDEAPGPTGKVIDLMEVLRQKLGAEVKKRAAAEKASGKPQKKPPVAGVRTAAKSKPRKAKKAPR